MRFFLTYASLHRFLSFIDSFPKKTIDSFLHHLGEVPNGVDSSAMAAEVAAAASPYHGGVDAAAAAAAAAAAGEVDAEERRKREASSAAAAEQNKRLTNGDKHEGENRKYELGLDALIV